MGSETYSVGDRVTLNCGGPEMSIFKEIEPNDYERENRNYAYKYECQWFDNKQLHSDVFAEASLIKVSKD